MHSEPRAQTTSWLDIEPDIHQPPMSDNMRPLRWLLNLSVVLQASGSAIARGPAPGREPLPPSQDPWYRAPRDFESKRPGDVLRLRAAPGNLTSVVGNTSAAYHILYRTTNSRGQPSWAVTTLFIPSAFYFSPSGKAAMLSYQFAYNTANLDSSPSIGLYWRMAQREPNLGLKSNTDLLNEMLSRGWIVNTPDHLGPDAAFGASVQGGHATLDAVRAILNLAHLTGNPEMKVNTVLWGYSGGSIATLAAIELQTKYAPELRIAGTTLGGVVDDISAAMDNINKSPIAGSLPALLLGITAQYPDARKYLESRLVPETRDEFMSVLDLNVADAVRDFARKDIYTYLKGGAEDLQAPILQKLFNEQAKLGHKGIPTMPLFVYKAIQDQFSPIEDTDKTAKRFCEAGVKINYERNTVGEHVSEIENGKPRAFRWIRSIFDESYEPPEWGCSIRNVTVKVPAERS
ncbi:lipase 1 precursor [Fusarium albosuccineum]|uniref:Lipase 1 n=1 Tax=Fusarium albosuccineum TaxID=1237068 RepID=A0A8H4LH93_9HYPO|nr:lipase 1 precursor [Fusarium albosuccineum]